MPDHSAQFEAIGGGLVLTNAILLYQTEAPPHAGARRNAPAFASMHAVERNDDDQPTIAAGTPLTRAHLRQWTEALGRTVLPEILPAKVLVAHPDMLMWWCPQQVRQAYFALTNPCDGLRILSERRTVPVPYPAHLFVATRHGLGVYALSANRRPDAQTRLLHSPILNVFVDGRLCWGNIPQPKALTVASIPEFERAVFESWSTHPNPGQELTVTGKGGLVRLWDNLAASRATRFPVGRLKPFIAGDRRRASRASGRAAPIPMTVGNLVAAGTRR